MASAPETRIDFGLMKAALGAIGLMALGLALANGLLASVGESPQFAFTLTGSFALYLATAPRPRHLLVVTAIALALRVIYGATYGIQPYFGSVVISAGCFLGIASLLALACRAVRRRSFLEFGVAAYFPFVSIVVGFILPVTNRLSPETFDRHLLSADGVLGFQPAFVLGSIVAERPAFRDLTSTVYYALPFAVALLCAAEFAQRPRRAVRLLWLFGAMSAAGFCLYCACPATGPRYAFPESFPLSVPDGMSFPLTTLSVPDAPRNAIPSLHFATALLVFWNVRRARKAARVAAGLFLAATSFAILGLGEHYFVDIVVAVPFSLFFQAVFVPAEWRVACRPAAIVGSAGLVALWLSLLRLSPETLRAWPAAAAAGYLITIGISIWLARRLHGPREQDIPQQVSPSTVGCGL